METREVHELVERLGTLDVACADRALLAARLADTERLTSWAESRRLVLASLMAGCASFPEDAIGAATRRSHREAARTLERSQVAEEVPALAEALADGAVSGSHLDALGDGLRRLEPHQRAEVDTDRLADVARRTTPDEFRRAVAQEVQRVQTDDGMARLEQQRRNTRLRSWTGRDGMVHLAGQFDPETGLALLGRLRNEVERRFVEHTPDTCPSDPFEKQDHLRALALVSLTEGRGPRSSLPEIIGVRDERCSGCPICSPSQPVAEPQALTTPSDDHGIAGRLSDVVPAALGSTTRRRGLEHDGPTSGDRRPGIDAPAPVDVTEAGDAATAPCLPAAVTALGSVGGSASDDTQSSSNALTPASALSSSGRAARDDRAVPAASLRRAEASALLSLPASADPPAPAAAPGNPTAGALASSSDRATPAPGGNLATGRQPAERDDALPRRSQAATAVIDWGADVTLPAAVADAIAARARHTEVVVRNGVVVSPTEGLRQGRATRLANRMQRRVLRALYPTCAVPGCQVRYPSTDIHHVVWWEHGGPTDLDNLLPLCSKHHHAVHDGGWQLALLPDRTLHVVFPDGTRTTTGPPSRAAP